MTPAHGPPPPLDYAPPPPAAPDRRPWGVMPRLAAVLVSAAFFLQIAFGLVVPPFEEKFKSFNLKLPGVTQLYLDATHWWNREYGWVFGWGLTLAVAVAAGVGAATHPGPGPGPPVRWGRLTALVLLTFVLIAAVTVAAVGMPMFTLIEGITNKPGGK